MQADGRQSPRATLGPYELKSPLGQGGGGEVFRAHDPRLQRDVALKILHARFENDPERVRSFIAEARAASALNHPNIVTVFDAAVDGDTPYIVSELLEGRSLREEITRGALPLKRLLDLAAQIADGLAAAHERGIRHGDVKPENIILSREGRAKIVDFGLSGGPAVRVKDLGNAGSRGLSDHLQTETVAGLVSGTVPYLSPEQARGLAGTLQSDQFSFGLVLYEMATGRRAFQRDTPPATLDAIINHEVPPMPQTAQVPVALKWIIERCLAKEPGDRYGATTDLHRDLRMLRDRLGETVVAGPAPVPRRGIWRWALSGVTALLLVAAGAGGAALFRERAGPDMAQISFAPLATDEPFEGLPAVAPNSATIAYVVNVDGTLQIFTRQLSSSTGHQVTHQRWDCSHPFWSPDGQRIYYVSLAQDRLGIWSIDVAGGPPQIVATNATRGAVSRDGRTFAFLRDAQRADIIGTGQLWVATQDSAAPWTQESVETSARVRDSFGGLKFIEGALAFSPDGTKLAVCLVPGLRAETGWQFWIVPLPAGKDYRRLETWNEPAPRITNLTWLPDSRHIVLGIPSLKTVGSQLWMADLEENRAWQITIGPDSQSYPSASPNGEYVVFTNGEPDYDLVEIPLDGRDIRESLKTTRNESDPDVSVKTGQLAYVTDRSGQDEIWIRGSGVGDVGRPRIQRSDFGENLTVMLGSPSLSPDGEKLAFQRNGYYPRLPLRIWLSTSAGSPSTLLVPATDEEIQGAPTWSPDGQWIAFGRWRDGQWQLVKVRVGTGEPPIMLRANGIGNAMPRWSPKDDLITWGSAEGLEVVPPDGGEGHLLHDEIGNPWLVHTWSRDGSEIIAITETAQRHLSLVAFNPRTDKRRVIRADLGPAAPVNNPVKGLTVSADGKTLTTSIARMRGDLWLLKGLDWRRASARR